MWPDARLGCALFRCRLQMPQIGRLDCLDGLSSSSGVTLELCGVRVRVPYADAAATGALTGVAMERRRLTGGCRTASLQEARVEQLCSCIRSIGRRGKDRAAATKPTRGGSGRTDGQGCDKQSWRGSPDGKLCRSLRCSLAACAHGHSARAVITLVLYACCWRKDGVGGQPEHGRQQPAGGQAG